MQAIAFADAADARFFRDPREDVFTTDNSKKQRRGPDGVRAFLIGSIETWADLRDDLSGLQHDRHGDRREQNEGECERDGLGHFNFPWAFALS